MIPILVGLVTATITNPLNKKWGIDTFVLNQTQKSLIAIVLISLIIVSMLLILVEYFE